MEKKNLAVFISGHGSNLNVFLENKDQFNKFIVISSNPNAYGLVRAKNHDVKSHILPANINWLELSKVLLTEEIDMIFLAGFMKIVPRLFIEQWQGRIFNIHPSLLPKFKGLHAIKRAYEASDDIGVTIHHVVSEVDGGQHLLQEVAIKNNELGQFTLEEVMLKTHQCEHRLVRNFIKTYC